MTISQAQGDPDLSTTLERQQRLEQIAAGQGVRLRRRSQIVLLAERGLLPNEIAAQVGLSPDRVRYWLRRYRHEGMAIFNPPVASALAATPDTPDVEQKDALSVMDLCRRYSVDMAHARYCVDLSLRLFDDTADIHKLPPEARRLLEIAALLHDIAYQLDPAVHHMLGRDILLEHPIVGLSDVERHMVACITGFHRKKVRPAKDPVFARLKKSRRREVLALAALLRLGDALDYSQGQTCAIAEVGVSDGALVITVEGEFADFNAARAQKMSDLWAELYDMPVRVQARRPAEAVDEKVWPSLDPALNLAEALRLLMGHYLAHVERDADLFRDGEDSLAAALEQHLSYLLGVLGLTGTAFDATVMADFKKDARWLHELANEAVGWQTLVARAREVLETDADLKRGVARALRAALHSWAGEANGALLQFREALDSKRYRRFLRQMLVFSRKPGEGVFPGPHLEVGVKIQAGPLIVQAAEGLRAEAGGGGEVYSQWQRVRRLDCLLHYFHSLLGPEAADLLGHLAPLEARLRAVASGETALALALRSAAALSERKGADRKKDKAQDALPGIEAFAAAQRAWIEAACADLEAYWEAVDSVSFRRLAAAATS